MRLQPRYGPSFLSSHLNCHNHLFVILLIPIYSKNSHSLHTWERNIYIIKCRSNTWHFKGFRIQFKVVPWLCEAWPDLYLSPDTCHGRPHSLQNASVIMVFSAPFKGSKQVPTLQPFVFRIHSPWKASAAECSVPHRCFIGGVVCSWPLHLKHFLGPFYVRCFWFLLVPGGILFCALQTSLLSEKMATVFSLIHCQLEFRFHAECKDSVWLSLLNHKRANVHTCYTTTIHFE